MPKKQKSAGSDNDEQANESSGSLSQNEDNTKCAQLDLLSDTTLHHLPIEILEMILIKAVVMEVTGLKLTKRARKEKADQVITGRLRSVCSLWSNVLSTVHFRTEVYRTLDDTAPDKIRLEVLQESSVKTEIHAVAALKYEIFTLRKVCKQYYAIDVYDRDNVEVVKDVIELPKSHVNCMIACNASNCLYVGLRAEDFPKQPLSVLRVWKDEDHKFKKSPWQHAHGRSIQMLSVTAHGGLLAFTKGDLCNPASAALHDANDSLQLEVFLPRYLGVIRYIIQKSNGNLVWSYDTEISSLNARSNTKLLEIDTTGRVVRHYESSLKELSRVHFADNCDRIMITECRRFELLDSEFNRLGVYCMPQDVGKCYYVYDLKYDREYSVIIRSHYDYHSKKNILTTFRFTEE